MSVNHAQSVEQELQLLLEVEVLLGGGRQLQSGLPTALQTIMQTFSADAIGLLFWQDSRQLEFDFPTAYGQTALLRREALSDLATPPSRQTANIILGQDNLIAVPMNGTFQRYGMLQLVYANMTHAPTISRLTLQLLGRQIGIALENAEHLAYLNRQTYELGIISRVGDSLLTLLSSLQIEKVAGSIMNAVKDLLDVEETSILLKDIETGDLILWQYTPPERNLAIRLQPGQGIGGWVLATGKSAIVNDVRADSRWEPQFDDGSDFTTRSMLAVPILLNGEVIGVIEALNKLNGDFVAADERWLHTLSQWASVAIGNANTYDELKRTHERLSDAKKHAAMAQMVLNLAHKINNSVGALRVFALEALEETNQLSQAAGYLKATIHGILENAEETLLMVRRIRESTELQSNSLFLVQIQDCLEAALLASRLERTIHIERDYEANVPSVAASPERLTEVFVNLLDNAADALGPKGQVRLTLRRTVNQSVEILIQDNGAGIPEHLRQTLFDPFVTSKTQGLGLGLWMVRLYIELIGGSIHVSTATGKGSTFRITLPASEG